MQTSLALSLPKFLLELISLLLTIVRVRNLRNRLQLMALVLWRHTILLPGLLVLTQLGVTLRQESLVLAMMVVIEEELEVRLEDVLEQAVQVLVAFFPQH